MTQLATPDGGNLQVRCDGRGVGNGSLNRYRASPRAQVVVVVGVIVGVVVVVGVIVSQRCTGGRGIEYQNPPYVSPLFSIRLFWFLL